MYVVFLFEANLCRFLINCLYINWRWNSSYEEERVRNPLIGLTPPHICVYPKSAPEFSVSYDNVRVFFVFSEWLLFNATLVTYIVILLREDDVGMYWVTYLFLFHFQKGFNIAREDINVSSVYICTCTYTKM